LGRFNFGQIVLAYFNDGAGRTKDRPGVIISRDVDNDAGLPLIVVAVTKRIDDPCPSYHVRLPHGMPRQGIKTGLTAPCVAKCNWVREVDQHRVIKVLGHAPATELGTIVDEYDALEADTEFDGWV
jgi:mRNA-degrading endonuclease toxin of MazEF toxin-antitoxin module